MDINDLFDGIAEAFRQYQAEMTEQEQTSVNPNPAGLEPETENGRGFDSHMDASCNHSANPSLKVAMSQVLS